MAKIIYFVFFVLLIQCGYSRYTEYKDLSDPDDDYGDVDNVEVDKRATETDPKAGNDVTTEDDDDDDDDGDDDDTADDDKNTGDADTETTSGDNDTYVQSIYVTTGHSGNVTKGHIGNVTKGQSENVTKVQSGNVTKGQSGNGTKGQSGNFTKGQSGAVNGATQTNTTVTKYHNNVPTGHDREANDRGPSGFGFQGKAVYQRPPGYVFRGKAVNQRPPGYVFQRKAVNQRPPGSGVQGKAVSQRPSGYGFQGKAVNQRPSGFGFQEKGLTQRPSGYGFQGKAVNQRPSGFGFQEKGLTQRLSGYGFQGKAVNQRPPGYVFRGKAVNQRPPGYVFQGKAVYQRQPGYVFQGKAVNQRPPASGVQGKAVNQRPPGSGVQGKAVNQRPSGSGVQGKAVNQRPSGSGFQGKAVNQRPPGSGVQGKDFNQRPPDSGVQRKAVNQRPSGYGFQGKAVNQRPPSSGVQGKDVNQRPPDSGVQRKAVNQRPSGYGFQGKAVNRRPPAGYGFRGNAARTDNYDGGKVFPSSQLGQQQGSVPPYKRKFPRSPRHRMVQRENADVYSKNLGHGDVVKRHTTAWKRETEAARPPLLSSDRDNLLMIISAADMIKQQLREMKLGKRLTFELSNSSGTRSPPSDAVQKPLNVTQRSLDKALSPLSEDEAKEESNVQDSSSSVKHSLTTRDTPAPPNTPHLIPSNITGENPKNNQEDGRDGKKDESVIISPNGNLNLKPITSHSDKESLLLQDQKNLQPIESPLHQNINNTRKQTHAPVAVQAGNVELSNVPSDTTGETPKSKQEVDRGEKQDEQVNILLNDNSILTASLTPEIDESLQNIIAVKQDDLNSKSLNPLGKLLNDANTQTSRISLGLQGKDNPINIGKMQNDYPSSMSGFKTSLGESPNIIRPTKIVPEYKSLKTNRSESQVSNILGPNKNNSLQPTFITESPNTEDTQVDKLVNGDSRNKNDGETEYVKHKQTIINKIALLKQKLENTNHTNAHAPVAVQAGSVELSNISSGVTGETPKNNQGDGSDWKKDELVNITHNDNSILTPTTANSGKESVLLQDQKYLQPIESPSLRNDNNTHNNVPAPINPGSKVSSKFISDNSGENSQNKQERSAEEYYDEVDDK